MKTKKLSFILLSLLTVLFFACNSSDSGQAESAEEAVEEVAEEMAEEVEEMAEEVDDAISSESQIALIVTHQVADFASWKEAYDAHADVRQEANIEQWALLTGKDDPNLVTVVGKVGDIEAARGFMQSEDLKQKMQEAGVIEEPKIMLGEVVFFNEEAAQSSTTRLYVSHEVEDYDAWKTVFDGKSDLHAEAGISIIAVARSLDNQNNVVVVSTAADFETLQNFVDRPELQEAMKEAGVVGEPTMNFMNLVTLDI